PLAWLNGRPTRFGTVTEALDTSTSRADRLTTQNSTEISSTASSATPAQIHATGGPDCVRVIVVSVLSCRSDRAVSCACRGLAPYSSLVSAPICFFVGASPAVTACSAERKELESGNR